MRRVTEISQDRTKEARTVGSLFIKDRIPCDMRSALVALPEASYLWKRSLQWAIQAPSFDSVLAVCRVLQAANYVNRSPSVLRLKPVSRWDTIITPDNERPGGYQI